MVSINQDYLGAIFHAKLNNMHGHVDANLPHFNVVICKHEQFLFLFYDKIDNNRVFVHVLKYVNDLKCI